MITSEVFFFSLLIILMFIAAISIVYSTIKLGITPMPSSGKAYTAMLKLVDEAGTGTIVDLGSGWGNLVIRLAKKYPRREVVGYELSILPWFTSLLLKKVFNLNNLTIHRQNFFQVEFSNASVVICYLFPEAMQKLSIKLRAEDNSVNFLISNNFTLPHYQPYKRVSVDDFYRSSIYLYKTTKHS